MGGRVGIYLRISDDRDGTQTATERQRESCEQFASTHGLEVVDVFEDVDVSAYRRNVTRPEFERMLASVTERQIDGVLAWKVDRLTRRMRDFVRLDEACEEVGGFVVTVADGIDTRTSTGRFVAELLVAQGRMESSNTGTRVRAMHKKRATRGEVQVGGFRPFGYTRDRSAVVPAEAALIREAADRILAGESIRGVCTDWVKRGVVSSAGKPWNPTPLRRMLQNPALAGLREYEGATYPATWDAILTEETSERLRLHFAEPNRRTSFGTARSYLLTGIVRCGRCGARLRSHRHKDGQRQYVCPPAAWSEDGCGRIARYADDVEELVTESVLIALDGADLRQYMATSEADNSDELMFTIREDEKALAELTQDYYVERKLTRSEFFTARDSLQARIEHNRREAARVTGHGVLTQIVGAGEAIRDQWADATLEWKRTVIGAVVDRVDIDPVVKRTGKFQPELVRITWRY